jgi:tetratricopeptide (TPR) repeat protein
LSVFSARLFWGRAFPLCAWSLLSGRFEGAVLGINHRWVCGLGTGILGVALLLPAAGCGTASNGQNLAGVRLHQTGQHQAALQRFQQAITADPVNPDSYYNMGATLHEMAMQRHNVAIQLQGQAQQRQREGRQSEADAYLAEADTAGRDADKYYEQAETLYNQCLDHDASHLDCHRALAVLLVETNRSDRAFTLLKRWAEKAPTSVEPRIELARLYEEFGEFDTAKRYLEESVQMDVQNSRAWAALARLREQSGNYQQALADYQRAYSIDNLQPGVANKIASLQQQLNRGVGVVPASATTVIR